MPERPSPIWYRQFSSGLFPDALRTIATDRPELVGMEQTIAGEIGERLKSGRAVNALDLGSMLSASWIAIATHFREEIGQGRVRMIATNAEPFSVEQSLAYARNRLRKQKKA